MGSGFQGFKFRGVEVQRFRGLGVLVFRVQGLGVRRFQDSGFRVLGVERCRRLRDGDWGIKVSYVEASTSVYLKVACGRASEHL